MATVNAWSNDVSILLGLGDGTFQLQETTYEVGTSPGAVVAGDFNDVWGRLGPVVLEPEGYHGSGRRIRTFPALRPLRPLDRVFASGPVHIAFAHRGRMRCARVASDHLPLVAELQLR